MSYKKLFSYLACTAVLSVFVAACGSAPQAPPMPVIKGFEAKNNIIESGKSTTLTWSVSDADTVEISGIGMVDASGSKELQPTSNTSYTLSARNNYGAMAEMTIGVTVTPPTPMPSITFNINPAAVKAEESAELSWDVKNADYVEIRGSDGSFLGMFPPRGNTKVMGKTKGTVSYTITAFGKGGKSDAKKDLVVNDFSVGDKLAISINFPTGSANIPRAEEPKLAEALTILSQKKNLLVEISGHTDNVGGKAPVKGKKEKDEVFKKRYEKWEASRKKSNSALSLRRAAAVKAYLVKNKIAARRMSVRGAGESEPVGDNSTEEGRAQNRRIELRATGTMEDVKETRKAGAKVRKAKGK